MLFKLSGWTHIIALCPATFTRLQGFNELREIFIQSKADVDDS